MEGFAETDFDTDSHLENFMYANGQRPEPIFNANLPEQQFSTADNNPQNSQDVLDGTEAQAYAAWKNSGTNLSFADWVAQQERRANRRAKWSKLGTGVLDFIFDYLGGKVGGQDSGGEAGSFDENVGREYEYEPEKTIMGMQPTTAYIVFSLVGVAAVGTTIYLVARNKPAVKAK